MRSGGFKEDEIELIGGGGGDQFSSKGNLRINIIYAILIAFLVYLMV